MLTYVVRRLLGMIPTLFIVSVLTFIITQQAQSAESGGSIDQAAMENLRAQYGLDQPLYVQYLNWVEGFPHGDFGYSFEWKKPVADLIGSRLGFTLVLSGLALLFTWLIAIPIGIYSATHQYSWQDLVLTTVGFLGLSIPDFMLGLIYLFVGVFVFNATAGGLESPQFENAPWTNPAKLLDIANHLIWPVII